MKFNMNKLRLKWKIFAFLLGFCALLLIILWLFQTVLLDYFYRGVKIIESKSNTNIIANNIDSENLSDLVDGISQNSDVCIEILLSDGSDYYSADVLIDCAIHKMPIHEKLELISNAREQGGEFSEYIIKQPLPMLFGNKEFKPPFWPAGNESFSDRSPFGFRAQSLVYVKLIEKAGGETFAIFMDSMISPVNSTVTTLRYQLYLITAIMFILSVLLALIIARRVSKPIEEINKGAKVLAGGNYDIHFNGKGFLEIGELSDTLNITATELSKVEALRRELMANISHDLRTPLSLIYSYAEMMHDFPDEIAPEQARIIMDETRRLTTLVNDVLDISKIETGLETLNISDFNLTQIIKTTTERVAELIKKDGYQISLDYDENVFVSADEVKIVQVYYNLLVNAVNYTGEDKAIIVRQIISDENVRIELADTGDGVDYESLPYIWDRYYKIDKNHKRGVTGTGLGLSIVKKIMELHGGSYGVEAYPGEGSTFWFSLKRN